MKILARAHPPEEGLREFKARVRREVEALLHLAPMGFRYADIAHRLGETFSEPGPAQRRLRRQLDRLCEDGLIYGVDRGIFIANTRTLTPHTPARLALEVEIRSSFHAAGGVMTASEILAEVAREDDGKARLVRQVLRDSSLYMTGVPIRGYRRHWFMVEAERRVVPLPGRLHMLEIAMIAPEAMGGRIDSALTGFRHRLAVALKAARNLRGLTVPDLICDADVAATLSLALGLAVDIPNKYPQSRGQESIADWWIALVEGEGAQEALRYAWEALEATTDDVPPLHRLTTVALWDAIGRVLNLEASLLSRGALARRT